jgi:hypothetical protein
MTSGAPWKTLAKLGSQTYVAGDTISFKAGDTWTGETFFPSGAGAYAVGTYNSTYSSTLASATATYLAGASFSDARADAIAAGKSGAEADTAATSYCHALASRDAMRAAHAAANAASTWITVGRYGAGADPIIDGNSVAQCCIRFGTLYAGGWKITSLVCKNATVANIDCEPSSIAQGLWIDVPSLTGAGGMPLPGAADGNYTTPMVPGFSNAWACGTCVKNVNYVYIKSGDTSSCDTPGMFFTCSDVMVDTPNMSNCRYQSLWFLGASRCLINGGVITTMMTQGWPRGTASVALVSTTDFVYAGTEISHTTQPNGEADGTGSDHESTQHITAYLGCHIHHNSGPAFEILVGNTSTGTVLADCTFDNNGTHNPATDAIILRADATPSDPIFFLRCSSVRAAVGQKLFSGTSHLTPNPTDTPNANWVYGPSNTVI